MKRPSSLENVTLADWAALYDSPQKPFVKKSKDIGADNLPLETADDEENDELPDCAIMRPCKIQNSQNQSNA